MKTYRTKRLILSLLCMVGVSAAQAQVHLATLEYWFDTQYDKRQTISIDGQLTQDIDVSKLCNGIHTLEMRVSDTNGRWGSTMLKYFLKPTPTLTGNQLTAYEYWIDDYANVQAGATSDGNILLDIDVATLSKGIHTFSYQVKDKTGRKSAPRLVYFLIPDLEAGTSMIAAYEYWFNHGSRTRVELQPASPTMSLDNVLIEVKDVVPNSLEGYQFYAETEQVTVEDNVFFGMQVRNADDHASLAVLSETFPMTVPVELNMLALSSDGEILTIDAPKAGRMRGMKSEVAVGDLLTYTLSSQDTKVDFYDGVGNPLAANVIVLETGEAVYTLEATATTIYALLYNAPDILNTLAVSMKIGGTTGIEDASDDAAMEVIRYNASGQVISTKQPGINIIRMSDGTVRKVLVK